jgi:16S rRNA (cytosine967-C5)-methyltransferase
VRGPSIARVIATRVLHRIAVDEAWASPALDAEIAKHGTSERDAALATAIVYGTLRALPSTDRAIDARRDKKGALEPVVHAALRAATFQLLHLRTPSHAVVSDAVAIVRAQRGEGLARFANAVLRKIAEDRPEEPSPPSALEVPRWLEDELARGVGEERARDFLALRSMPPPLALRVLGGDRGTLIARIREARHDAEVRETRGSPMGILVSKVGDPRALPGWDRGLFAVQDEGSQLVALLAGARAGETVHRVGAEGSVTAIDLHEAKLERIDAELARLRLPRERVSTMALDLSVGIGGLEGRFDRVLVDAPCTGIGTVHRRPEILLRIQPGDPARMADLQLAIARSASRMVKPGGTLVYAVCSPTRAEGPGVAERLLAEVPGLAILADRVKNVPLAPDADGVFRIGPYGELAEDGPDAYQVIRFRVSG